MSKIKNIVFEQHNEQKQMQIFFIFLIACNIISYIIVKLYSIENHKHTLCNFIGQ